MFVNQISSPRQPSLIESVNEAGIGAGFTNDVTGATAEQVYAEQVNIAAVMLV